MKPTCRIRKILIMNVFGIGDVLFTTPLISAVKRHDSSIKIGYMCNRRSCDLFENNSDVDKVFVYERDEFDAARKRSPSEFMKVFFGLVNSIKAERYDCLIDVSLMRFTGFIGFLSGIKLRIGFDYKRRSTFLNQKYKIDGYEGRHVIEHYCDLLERIGIKISDKRIKISVSDDDVSWAENYLKRNGLNGNVPLIGMIPGGGASWGSAAYQKRWPVDNYAKLADKLIEKYRLKVILFGSSAELDICNQMQKAAANKLFCVAGGTTLKQFSALARRCRFLILNDGGPLHIAVASGVKTVSIFGPVDEDVYGPYPADGHLVITNPVSCRPCYRRFRMPDCSHFSCLNKINVDDVIRKVEEFYESSIHGFQQTI